MFIRAAAKTNIYRRWGILAAAPFAIGAGLSGAASFAAAPTTAPTTRPAQAWASGPAIYKAAATGDLPALKRAIAAGADLNAPDLDKGWTPLLYAVQGHHLPVVEALLAAGANPTLNSQRTQMSPLADAAAEGQMEIMKRLLAAGADVNAATPPSLTPLQYAAANGRLQAADYLLDQGADVNRRDARARTALQLAASNGQLKMVQRLLARGARLIAFPDGLYYAAAHGHLPVVQYLLAHGGRPDANFDGLTPVTAAGMNNHPAVVRYLLDHGAPINHKTRQESRHAPYYQPSLVSSAAANGDLLLLKELLQRGGRYNNGDPGVVQAAQRGHADCLRLLLNRGIHPDEMDKVIRQTVANGHLQAAVALFQFRRLPQTARQALAHAATRSSPGQTADSSPVGPQARNAADRLLIAAYEDKPEAIQAILKQAGITDLLLLDSARILAERRGNIGALRAVAPPAREALAKVKAQTELNRRLIAACEQGDVKQAARLLKQGADPGAWDPAASGSALDEAVGSGNTAMVQVLLDHGADINARVQGRTALRSLDKNKTAMLKFLLDHGADPNQTGWGFTPLTHAAAEGDLATMEILLAAGAKLDATNNYDRRTPLIWAAAEGKPKAVQWLLEKGASPDTKDEHGDTAMAVALANGKADVAAVLRRHGVAITGRAADAEPDLLNIFNGGYDGVLRWLNHGGDPNVWVASQSITPLEYAVERLNETDDQGFRILKLLVQRGAKVNGSRLLLWDAACRGRSVEMLKFLIAHGSDPNEVNGYNGETPLMGAARNGMLEQVKFLLHAGAEPRTRRHDGQTALDLARQTSHPDLIAVLNAAMKMKPAATRPTTRLFQPE